MNSQLESVYAKYGHFWERHSNKVKIAGITHFVEETEISYRIYKNKYDPDLASIFIKKDAHTLRRSEADFAETVLRSFFEARISEPVQSITAIISLENFLERPFQNNLFKTILAEILKNKLGNGRQQIKTEASQDWTKIMVSNIGFKPFLSVAKNETDKEILGRLLCGVYLSEVKANQPIFPLAER